MRSRWLLWQREAPFSLDFEDTEPFPAISGERSILLFSCWEVDPSSLPLLARTDRLSISFVSPSPRMRFSGELLFFFFLASMSLSTLIRPFLFQTRGARSTSSSEIANFSPLSPHQEGSPPALLPNEFFLGGQTHASKPPPSLPKTNLFFPAKVLRFLQRIPFFLPGRG